MEAFPRVRTLFEGSGKAPVGQDGRTRDCSSSGYDYSLALELIKKGITDPSEIATTIWLRPDESAQLKGIEYIAHTISSAMAFFEDVKAAKTARRQEADTDPETEIDFVVDRVLVTTSVPAIYIVVIDGKELISRPRLLTKTRRSPSLPISSLL
jgi:hypothetical protein